MISGIIHVLKRGLQWCDAPKEYGPHKTLYNRFKRWSEMGIFDKIFHELSSQGMPEQLQIDATHLKAQTSPSTLQGLSLAKKAVAFLAGRAPPPIIWPEDLVLTAKTGQLLL